VRFTLVRLDATHERHPFHCASPALDQYFRSQITQDVRRHVAVAFVAVSDAGDLAGFYTLSAASIVLGDLPAQAARKLPRYPTVPAVRLGRLAVDTRFAGQGLGGALLVNALARAASADIGAYAMTADAKDEAAAAFYRHHGFLAFERQSLVLFRPLTREMAGWLT